MLYEIHMLKNYGPVNLNRDDAGSPKTVNFGGSVRNRISSQCLKRSWRTSPVFRDAVAESNLGVRTRKFPLLVKEKLIELGVSEDLAEAVMPAISGLGNKEGKENKDPSSTAQVVFYSHDDIDRVAVAVKTKLEGCASVKEVRKLKAKDLLAEISDVSVRPVSVDIALFGRMVTCDAFRDVEAACQVAHAVSTNKQAVESDYFTAMDDLLTGGSMDENGAAMIGDFEFGSACYYAYANIDSDALRDNLSYADDPDLLVKKTIPALIQAMAFSNPSGKQNSFAGHTLPSVIMVECKEQKIPTNLVNAFVEPVYGGKDLIRDSAQRLADEADLTARNFGLKVKERLWFIVDKYEVKPASATKVCKNFQELVDAVSATM